MHEDTCVVIVPEMDEVLDFCAEDPVERVLLEDIARRGLGRFVAVRGNGRLAALCHVGTNIVPSGDGCAAFAARALDRRSRMLVGAEGAVDELWSAMRDRVPAPQDDRPGQPVYAIETPPPPGDSGLRPAVSADLGLLVPACAAAHEEEIGTNPLAQDAEGFRWRTRAQIDEGRSWLWREGGTICFKAEASAWTPSAVQIQQVWVDPALRGRGYGARGMRDLCRLLLERTTFVTLFVRSENAAAIALYESIGMRLVGRYRSLLF